MKEQKMDDIKEQEEGVQTPQMPGMEDYLLQDFSASHSEYIVKNIYPQLKQTLNHFIMKSLQNHKFKTKMENTAAVNQAKDLGVGFDDMKENSPNKEKDGSPKGRQERRTSAFGDFKMDKGDEK